MIAPQFSITYDGGNPTLSISSTESDPTNATSFVVTFDFNETVTGFTLGDIAVANGTVGSFSGSAAQYFSTFTPSGAAVTVDVAADLAFDAAGNGNVVAPQFSITWDNTDPTLSISSTESDPTNTSPFIATFDFNETVGRFLRPVAKPA